MIKDLRYIIKKVIIGVLIGLCFMFIKQEIPHAAIIYNIRHFGNNGYSSSPTTVWSNDVFYNNANVERDFQFLGVGEEPYTQALYFQILYCVNANNLTGVAWSNANDPQSYVSWGTRNSIQMNITNLKCTIPTYNYIGQVVQVTGVTATANDGGGDITTSWRVSFNQNATYNMTYYGLQTEQYEPLISQQDYTNAINSVTNAISSQTTAINNQTTLLVDKFNWLGGKTDTTNTKIDQLKQTMNDMKDTMSDDSIDGNDQDSKINSIKNSGYNNNSISSIVLLPVRLFDSALDGLESSSCSSINLGNLYNTDLIMPCISQSDMQTWLSSSLYNVIDILMSLCVILGIRKLVLKIYSTIVYLREGGGTID